MKWNKKYWYYGGAGLAVIAVAAMIASGGGKAAETVKVREATVLQSVEDTGYVQSAGSLDLYATQSARITALPVEVGQRVQKGGTLMTMSNPDLAIQISEAAGQLAQVRSSLPGLRAGVNSAQFAAKDAADNLNRAAALKKTGGISDVDYEQAVLQSENSQQALQGKQAELQAAIAQETGLAATMAELSHKQSELTLNSPIDGVVLALPVKREQVTMPGTLLATVGTAQKLEIKADILSDDLGDVRLNQPVAVTAPILGTKPLKGRVTKIYPRAEEKLSALGVIQRRVPVIVSLPESSKLMPGYEVRVAIITKTAKQVPVVPLESVRTDEQNRKSVMKVVDGRVVHQQITAGISDQENVQILRGLKRGDEVVRDAGTDLAEGAKIKTQ